MKGELPSEKYRIRIMFLKEHVRQKLRLVYFMYLYTQCVEYISMYFLMGYKTTNGEFQNNGFMCALKILNT